MMNKSKTSKARYWKVATFLPALAILLMAFGKRGESVPEYQIPAEKIIVSPVIVPTQNQLTNQLTNQIIEIKKDGNFIDNKQCSLDEIAAKGKKWYETSNKWILLLVDESVPLNRINEVREALKHDYWIVQTTVNSNDLVYFAGDVSDGAKFKEGKFNDWLTGQLKNYSTINPTYAISFSFIIGKDGKVRNSHIIKSSGYTEVDQAYEKILSNIPDWVPAKRGSENVSVYNHIGRKSYGPPVK